MLVLWPVRLLSRPTFYYHTENGRPTFYELPTLLLDDPEDISSECDPAKTVLEFQVSSLYTMWSEIARLLPCCNTKAFELLPIVQQVLLTLRNVILE